VVEGEDGIRDWSVTGVQTCALPICQITLHLALVKPREDGNAGGVMRNESQRLTRMVGVAMQRDGRAKAFCEGERMIAPLVDVQPRQVGYHGVPPFCCRVWFRCEAEDYPNGVTFRSGGK